MVSKQSALLLHFITPQAACTVLAKQLVQLRKQKQRTYVASSQITAAGYTAKAMGANVRIAEAMGETTKTMGQGGVVKISNYSYVYRFHIFL